jgi:hypothetical protein
MNASEKQLPAEIVARADLRSNELAWHPSDIPAVIEAARRANLISLGGDLQIRAPSGLWGEPVGAGFSIELSDDLPWERQVEETAKAGLADFQSFQERSDFEAIARESFPQLIAEVREAKDVIFFSWAVADEKEAKRLNEAVARWNGAHC